jgi:hypothetical protein
MLLALLPALAFAGEISVILNAPGAVLIDGQRVEASGEGVVKKQNLAGGVHLVEIWSGRSRLGQLELDVPVTHEARLIYDAGELRLLGAGPLANAAQSVPKDDRVVVVSGPGQPAEAPLGSLAIKGVPQESKVSMNKQRATWSRAELDFVSTGLKPGLVDLVVEGPGAVGFAIQVDVRAGVHTQCELQNLDLRCFWDGPARDDRSSPALVIVRAPTSMNPGVVPPVLSPIQPPVGPAPGLPVVPLPPVGPQPLDDQAFGSLLKAVDEAPFSDDQLGLLKVASSGYFTCDQVGALIDQISFSADKVEAVQILRPHIVDPQNAHTLNEHLSFSDDRRKVMAMFQP